MKPITLLAAFAAFALPALSHAAPLRHAAVKKSVRHATPAAKTVTATRSVVTVPTSEQPAGSRPFSDVPPDHWAAAAVETLRQRGIVKGYPAEASRTK